MSAVVRGDINSLMLQLSHARAWPVPFQWGVILCAVLASVAFGLTPPAEATGGRPSFQIPFRCGERWEASTRSGHRGIDWNKGNGSADLGRAVAASAAGI